MDEEKRGEMKGGRRTTKRDADKRRRVEGGREKTDIYTEIALECKVEVWGETVVGQFSFVNHART